MAKNSIPSIPKARYSDIGQQRNSDSVGSAVDVLAGRKGNGLDRAVLVRDLKDLGIASLSKTASGQVIAKYDPPERDEGQKEIIQPPTEPKNFEVKGGFSSIILSWDEPDYIGHAYTEVWRSDTDDFSDAFLRDKPSSRIWADSVDYSSKFYYWIRHVNKLDQKSGLAGNDSTGGGLYGETAPNITDVIKDLDGKLDESTLAGDLAKNYENLKTSIVAKVGGKVKVKLPNGAVVEKEAIGGFGLSSDKTTGSIDAGFNVDRFWIGRVSVNGQDQVVGNYPFKVINDPKTGVGTVYMDNAMIQDAFIKNLVVETVTGDEIKGRNISGINLYGAHIRGGDMQIGTAANRKFIVDAAGNMTSRDARIVGNLIIEKNINSATGIKIDGDRIIVKEGGVTRVIIGKL